MLPFRVTFRDEDDVSHPGVLVHIWPDELGPLGVVVLEGSGRIVLCDLDWVVCTEPAYVTGQAPAEHEHILGPATPVLEGARVRGTERRCTVPGCAYVEPSR